MLQLAYGYRASDPGGKELIKLVDDAMDGFSETTKTNAFLVDVFPIRPSRPLFSRVILLLTIANEFVVKYVPAWFPGAGWKQKAKLYRGYLEEMLLTPYELVKRQMVRQC